MYTIVINGTVSGGNGGTAYSNAATTEDTSYSTMVYVPALSGFGGFGRGGNGILFANYRKNLNITGGGVVKAGNAGNIVDREGADVNNSAAEAIPFFSNPADYNNTVTVLTENGSSAVAESKTPINVQASMDSFAENPSTDTELHCEAELPAGCYTGDVYITWAARLYPNNPDPGDDPAGQNPGGQNPGTSQANQPGQNTTGSSAGQQAGSTGGTGSVATGVNAQKKTNPMQLKGRTAKVKYKKLKKKAQSLAVSKVITFTGKAEGAVSYKLYSAKKGRKSFKKYFKINASTGKVKIKKGLKKGTYKVKVKVTAGGNANYEASGTQTVTFKVKVK